MALIPRRHEDDVRNAFVRVGIAQRIPVQKDSTGPYAQEAAPCADDCDGGHYAPGCMVAVPRYGLILLDFVLGFIVGSQAVVGDIGPWLRLHCSTKYHNHYHLLHLPFITTDFSSFISFVGVILT